MKIYFENIWIVTILITQTYNSTFSGYFKDIVVFINVLSCYFHAAQIYWLCNEGELKKKAWKKSLGLCKICLVAPEYLFLYNRNFYFQNCNSHSFIFLHRTNKRNLTEKSLSIHFTTCSGTFLSLMKLWSFWWMLFSGCKHTFCSEAPKHFSWVPKCYFV